MTKNDEIVDDMDAVAKAMVGNTDEQVNISQCPEFGDRCWSLKSMALEVIYQDQGNGYGRPIQVMAVNDIETREKALAFYKRLDMINEDRE